LPGGCPTCAVVVSRHAVDRYRDRILRWEGKDLPYRSVVLLLREAVRRGKRVSRLPGNNVWQYAYQGLYLAVAHKPGAKVVLTCLGDKEYRLWYRKKGKR
jgi:hypothetical protein